MSSLIFIDTLHRVPVLTLPACFDRVIFQPRWLIKVARKQCPHIVFDHATKGTQNYDSKFFTFSPAVISIFAFFINFLSSPLLLTIRVDILRTMAVTGSRGILFLFLL